MTGNCHVRFLEGRTPAMGFGYSIVSRWRGGRALCVFNAVFVLQGDGEARVSEIGEG